MAFNKTTNLSNLAIGIPDVVDAPTIGTATPGGGRAVVPFTPNIRGGLATSYTAISTPGSITASAASSPITVTGLTNGTAYTFKVYGSNVSGTWSSLQSDSSNSVTPQTTSFVTVVLPDGSNSGSALTCISKDSSSNYYISGIRVGGAQYMYNTKFNSSSSLQWQKSLDSGLFSSQVTEYYDVVSDSSGNTYNAGRAFTNSPSTRKAVITKYNTSGTIQFQKSLLLSTGFAYFRGVDIDSTGNIVACGDFNSSSAVIIAKYNSSGVLQWQRQLTDSITGMYLYGIATDSSNNIYVTGSRRNSGNTGSHIFTAKYNSSGIIQWQRILYTVLNSGTSDEGRGISVDSSGNVYITGIISYATNPTRGFIAKYNTSGTLQWQRQFDTNNASFNVSSPKIISDSSGNTYVCGPFADPIGGNSSFLLKYNTSGVLQWQRKLRDTTRAAAPTLVMFDVQLDSEGYILVCGYSINSGATAYIGNFWRLNPDGSDNGTLTVGGQTVTISAGSLTEAAATATDAAGPLTDAAGTATDATESLTESTPIYTASTQGL